jgi:SAM-dependent methyltransferase
MAFRKAATRGRIGPRQVGGMAPRPAVRRRRGEARGCPKALPRVARYRAGERQAVQGRNPARCGRGRRPHRLRRPRPPRGAGLVVFSEVSQDLLDHSRTLAAEMGVLDRCQFVRAPAEDLSPISDASVDAITTRSVLIYVADKGRAFEEFHRVLRPGGRVSVWEPINRFGRPNRPSDGRLFAGYDVASVRDLARRVGAVRLRARPALRRGPPLGLRRARPARPRPARRVRGGAP